jgi:hypothetical protein
MKNAVVKRRAAFAASKGRPIAEVRVDRDAAEAGAEDADM